MISFPQNTGKVVLLARVCSKFKFQVLVDFKDHSSISIFCAFVDDDILTVVTTIVAISRTRVGQ